MKKRKLWQRFACAFTVMAMVLGLVGDVPLFNMQADVNAAENVTLQDSDFTGDLWNDGIWTITPNTWDNTLFEYFTYADDAWMTTTDNQGETGFHFWMQDMGNFTLTQSVDIPAGTYKLSADAMGEDATVYLMIGDAQSEGKTLTAYNTWDDMSAEFTVDEDIQGASVGFYVECSADGYGYIDSISIETVQDTPDDTFQEIEGYAWVETSYITNGTFETGDLTGWDTQMSGDSSTGYGIEVSKDEYSSVNQTYAINYYNDSTTQTAPLTITQTISGLPAGTYKLSYETEGAVADSGLTLSVSGKTSNITATTGWDNWQKNESDVFTLAETGNVTVTISGSVAEGYWGKFDNIVLLSYQPEEPEDDTTVEGDINVEKIPNLPDDYIMGMDISSYISERQSGVVYYDFDGNALDDQGFFNFLKSCGVTHIRVRVWNDPYDADRNGYGGGNNDVDKAVQIAKWCAEADLKLLVDFHYSDFWADPGKQQAPKEWADYSLTEKANAIKEFTRDALGKIIDTGVDVDMVQVGNETTNSFVGESGTNYADMCTLFKAASEEIRDIDSNIKIVIHLTNPERTNQLVNWAARLQTNGVDYDILATSYYPYWHGTLANLKSQFQTVRETYGKDVMVAETSYAYTLEDSDGHDNTVRAGNNESTDTEKDYAFTPQGQADFLRDLMAAVNEAGGLGVFYWESAWITVGDTTGLTGAEYEAQVEANKELWEEYGSGWASSYASEYDPDDAGVWYGGSAVDNQAMFYSDGSPVESINVWNYVKTGAVSNNVSVDSIQSYSDEIWVNGTYTLPDKVTVTYNTGAVDEDVNWDSEDVDKIDTSKPGTYVVNGKVSFSKEINSGTYSGMTEADVTYTLTVKEANLITDSNAAGFETADSYDISGSGIRIPSVEDVLEGSGTLHWYNASALTGTVTYTDTISLKAGWYTFETLAMGYAGDTVTLKILNVDGEVLFSGDETVLAGWTNSPSQYLSPSVTFLLEEDTEITYQVELGIQDGGWGSVDAAYLHRHETTEYVDNGDGTRDVNCADCGMYLTSETIPVEDNTEDDTTNPPDEEGTTSQPTTDEEGTTSAPSDEEGTTTTPSTDNQGGSGDTPEADVQTPSAETDNVNGTNDSAAKTNDEAELILYATLLLISIAASIVVITKRKNAR